MNSGRVLVIVYIFLLFGITFSSCGEKSKPLIGRGYNGLLFGKPYSVDVVGDSTDYQIQFDSITGVFEKLFDSNNPNSLVNGFNSFTDVGKAFEFKDSTLIFGLVFDVTRDLNRKTLQYFDPTMMPLKREWMVAKMMGRPEPNLDSLFEFVGFDGVKIDLVENLDGSSYLRKKDKRSELDLTDVAKAIALDHIADFLRSKNADQFRISYGRDVITHGFDVDTLNVLPMGVTSDASDLKIRMHDAAFSYTNVQDKQSMVDPTYGYPVDNEMAYVGVVAPTLAEAKIFAQSFLIMGIEKASEYYNANEDSKINSYMFYQRNDSLTSASTNGFDALIIGTGIDNPAE